MPDITDAPACFNCGRTDREIPLVAWQFEGRPLWACSECTPLLIHKWSQVKAALPARLESG